MIRRGVLQHGWHVRRARDSEPLGAQHAHREYALGVAPTVAPLCMGGTPRRPANCFLLLQDHHSGRWAWQWRLTPPQHAHREYALGVPPKVARRVKPRRGTILIVALVCLVIVMAL